MKSSKKLNPQETEESIMDLSRYGVCRVEARRLGDRVGPML